MEAAMMRKLLVAWLCFFAFASHGAQSGVQRVARHYKFTDSTLTGTVSFSGRLQSFTDYSTGNLYVRDLRTGETRLLVEANGLEGADYSAMSADGKRVAYAWFNREGSYELRVVSLDGSPPRVLYRSSELYYVEPRDWSRDGKQILADLWKKDYSSQIALVSVEDGSVRVLKTFRTRPWGKLMGLSPDGRYVAYDHPPKETSPDRDIFLLPVDGSPEIHLIVDPANDLFFGWTPDGKQILFASDRSGTWDAWLLGVAEGRPQGPPELVKSGIGPVLPSADFPRDRSYLEGLGFTADGSYYYGFSAWENDLYLTRLDPATGKLAPPEILARYLGFNTSAEWSLDGQSLAYVSWDGFEIGSFLLRIRLIETGQERRFPLAMTRFQARAFQPHWSPDGTSLLAQGSDVGWRQGVYRINARTGKVTPVVQTGLCSPDCIEWPVWSPDGKLVFTRWTAEQPAAARRIIPRDVKSGRERELYRAAPPAWVSHLAVSRDARHIAFIETDPEKQTSVLKTIPVSGALPRELLRVQAPETIFELAWTPENRHLVYGTGTTGKGLQFKLWRVSADGSQAQELGLARQGVRLYGLSVHPDGERIAFTAGTPLRGELWVLENFLPVPKTIP